MDFLINTVVNEKEETSNRFYSEILATHGKDVKDAKEMYANPSIARNKNTAVFNTFSMSNEMGIVIIPEIEYVKILPGVLLWKLNQKVKLLAFYWADSIETQGREDDQVILGANANVEAVVGIDLNTLSFSIRNLWLDAIDADLTGSTIDKVVNNKQVDAIDT